MKKKSSKELLFEMMHKVSGMPLSKLNEHEVTVDDVKDAAEDHSNDHAEVEKESPSYQGRLDRIGEYASELHDKIAAYDELPAWVQDKITIAEHNLEAISSWITSEGHEVNPTEKEEEESEENGGEEEEKEFKKPEEEEESEEEEEDDDSEEDDDTVKMSDEDKEALK